jgi:Leucine-rich repeat (LRR) protein
LYYNPGVESLKDLALASNSFKKIPSGVITLGRHLKLLNISRNLLTALPDDIDKLSGLTMLNISNNNVTRLPSSIGKLSKLTEFIANNNKIQELPKYTPHIHFDNLETNKHNNS